MSLTLIREDIILSLPESILFGVTAVVFIIMLLKQCRVLYVLVLSAVSSIILFTVRIIGDYDAKSAFVESFGLLQFVVLIFFFNDLFKKYRSKKYNDGRNEGVDPKED